MSPWPRLFATLCLTLLPWAGARADLVVVVNAGSGVENLTRSEVINIFLGRYRQLPSGIAAMPVDQPQTGPDKALFYDLLVHKDLAEINAYWARLMFSGKTSPPQQTASGAEVLAWLAKHKGAVGYIDRALADSRVRIVLDLER